MSDFNQATGNEGLPSEFSWDNAKNVPSTTDDADDNQYSMNS